MERPAPRTLLERLVRESDLSWPEMCKLFNQVAVSHGEKTTLSVRQLGRWMAGDVHDFRPAARRVAQLVWGHPVELLLGPPNLPAQIEAVEVDSDGINPGTTWEAAVQMAANESTNHAASSGGGVEPDSIEQIQDDLFRLAVGYGSIPPLTLLMLARRSRDMAFDLLERTHRPAQTRDLYAVAGRLCGLMASASFDLGGWDAAIEQARAASVYADVVGDPELRTWARGTTALVAYWRGQPRRAVEVVASALSSAPAGAAAARLHAIGARAYSHIGDQEQTEAMLRAADAAMESADGSAELHEQIGGEFGWDLARHTACAGTALLQVGAFLPATERSTRALELIGDGGLESADRAHVDLAAAFLGQGQLDAVAAQLATVWNLPSDQRRTPVTGRLLDLSRALTIARWQGVGEASDLRDHIEAFTSEVTTTAALPS